MLWPNETFDSGWKHCSNSEYQTRDEKIAGGEGVRQVGMWACSE
jgi:hypothetical protein